MIETKYDIDALKNNIERCEKEIDIFRGIIEDTRMQLVGYEHAQTLDDKNGYSEEELEKQIERCKNQISYYVEQVEIKQNEIIELRLLIREQGHK